MEQIELEVMVASQLLRSPHLIYSMPIDILDIRSVEVREIIKAIKELHITGLKMSRPEIVRYCPNVESVRMSQIAVATTNSENFNDHIKAIQTCIRKDKLTYLADIISSSLNDGESPDMIISRVELYIAHLDNTYDAGNVLGTFDMITQGLVELEEKRANPGTPGVTTGYEKLNSLFGGFERSKLYYIGARPSDGKTALMLNMAVSLLREDIPFGLVSVESSLKELRGRMLAIAGGVFAEDVTYGTLEDAEVGALRRKLKPIISNQGLYFHTAHATIGEVEAQVARMVAKEEIAVVFVDYMQLIEGGKFRARHEEVAYVSRQLKAIALRLNVAVVALAQMRRDVDGRAAMMSDFAESSALEKDADVMMAIEHNRTEMIEKSKITVLKARDGKTGAVDVEFNRGKLIFKEER